MDIFNIFDSDPLNLTLTVCSGAALLSAFFTLSLYVGPTKQYLRFANIVANTRTLWDCLEDQEGALYGGPSPKWLDILTRSEADVVRHATISLRPSSIAQVSLGWLNIVELLYLTLKIVRLHGRLQATYFAYQEGFFRDPSPTPTITMRNVAPEYILGPPV